MEHRPLHSRQCLDHLQKEAASQPVGRACRQDLSLSPDELWRLAQQHVLLGNKFARLAEALPGRNQAELRVAFVRGARNVPGTPTFWRLYVRRLAHTGLIDPQGMRDDEAAAARAALLEAICQELMEGYDEAESQPTVKAPNIAATSTAARAGVMGHAAPHQPLAVAAAAAAQQPAAQAYHAQGGWAPHPFGHGPPQSWQEHAWPQGPAQGLPLGPQLGWPQGPEQGWQEQGWAPPHAHGWHQQAPAGGWQPGPVQAWHPGQQAWHQGPGQGWQGPPQSPPHAPAAPGPASLSPPPRPARAASPTASEASSAPASTVPTSCERGKRHMALLEAFVFREVPFRGWNARLPWSPDARSWLAALDHSMEPTAADTARVLAAAAAARATTAGTKAAPAANANAATTTAAGSAADTVVTAAADAAPSANDIAGVAAQEPPTPRPRGPAEGEAGPATVPGAQATAQSDPDIHEPKLTVVPDHKRRRSWEDCRVRRRHWERVEGLCGM
ncbi:hypothetical protein HYH03_014073 [Edaphochlamys debaryana]|uniref:Uncharacterized protein n=1 Tax=Edaphochlamys debaryana TaxID=47281 RepID=A0A836BSL0_9CHLO|nr:hypothetical protein HYH03_014073 [Edaphochlamys debaryana]|eukprot:KAG2487360.1 hypothetical protein HYH03_014073 [Edaphochlamys debaryana]